MAPTGPALCEQFVTVKKMSDKEDKWKMIGKQKCPILYSVA